MIFSTSLTQSSQQTAKHPAQISHTKFRNHLVQISVLLFGGLHLIEIENEVRQKPHFLIVHRKPNLPRMGLIIAIITFIPLQDPSCVKQDQEKFKPEKT